MKGSGPGLPGSNTPAMGQQPASQSPSGGVLPDYPEGPVQALTQPLALSLAQENARKQTSHGLNHQKCSMGVMTPVTVTGHRSEQHTYRCATTEYE